MDNSKTFFKESYDNLFKSNNKQFYLQYGLLYLFLILFCILLSRYANKKDPITVGQYLQLSVFAVPIIALIIIFSLANREKNKIAVLMYGIAALVVISLLVFFYTKVQNLSSTYRYYLTVFSQTLIIMIILVGMTFFYNIFQEKLRRLPGTLGIAMNLIFFIPCLINDFIAYISGQFRNTPAVTYIIFSLEVLLILAYMYLPHIFKKSNSHVYNILNEAQFLNSRITLVYGEDLPKNEKLKLYNSRANKITMIGDQDETIHRNFSLSMWLYLNNQSQSAEEKHIFSYSPGKLNISYISQYENENETLSENLDKQNKVKFTLIEKDNQSITTYVDLPKQKWNNIVVNYNNNICTLFINGAPVISKEYVDFIPTYNNSDKIEIGNNNLEGAICNIQYFSEVLSEREIISNYNLLLNVNPPVNNII